MFQSEINSQSDRAKEAVCEIVQGAVTGSPERMKACFNDLQLGQDVTGGDVVTSGRFTADAQAFVEGLNVKLIDGPRLFGLIRQARPSLSAGTTGVPPMAPVSAAAVAPVCPVCTTDMVMRIAKKGANAGSQFWGCSTYPGCRGSDRSNVGVLPVYPASLNGSTDCA